MQINLALVVSSENDSAPVSVEIRLNGERSTRIGAPRYSFQDSNGGRSTTRAHLDLDSSLRSLSWPQSNWHPDRVPAFGPNFGKFTAVTPPPLASPKSGSPRARAKSPREISMQSPRNRYSPTNKDPKWGFRHDVDLNNCEGALSDYRIGYDVATLKAHTVVRPGTSANWSLRIVRLGYKHASRFGVISSNILAKKDWCNHDLIGATWYLTPVGFFNGASLCERSVCFCFKHCPLQYYVARLHRPERVCCGNSRKTKIKDNDILGLHLMWTPENRGIMKFTINGVNVPGDISGMLFAALLLCACAGVCVRKCALVSVAARL